MDSDTIMSKDEIEKRYAVNDAILTILGERKKAVLILEKIQDIDFLMYLHAIKAEGLCVVAVSPAVSWELEKKFIPHKLLNEYFDFEYEFQLAFENIYKIDKMCEDLDDLLFDIKPTISKYSFTVSKNLRCYIKNFYDGVVFRINILKKIIDIEKPDIIITVTEKSNFSIDRSESLLIPFSQKDSIYSAILTLEGGPCDSIQIIRKPKEKEKNKPKTMFIHLKNFLNSIIKSNGDIFLFLYFIKYGESRKAFSLLYSLILRHKGKKNLIVTSFSRDWMEVIPELYRSGYRVSFFKDIRNDNEDKNNLFKINLSAVNLNRYCNIEGFDFSLLFTERVSNFLKHIIYKFEEYIPAANDALQKKNPLACIGGVELSLEEKHFVLLAQYRNIPKITWQHGSVGYYGAPNFVYTELDNSNFYFVYGEGVTEMYHNYKVNTDCKIIPMGSPTLVKIQNEKKSPVEKSRILYATMGYYLNSLYFDWDHRIDDITLWHAQKDIISFLGMINYETYLKLHSYETEDYIIREFVSIKKYCNIKIFKNELTFCDLLYESDIIILDNPSTVLLEAIAARKTIFVLLKFIKISEKAKELLKKRAFCSENVDELLIQVQKYLNHQEMEQSPDIDNTEFLEHYGVHYGEKQIPERVLEVLGDINR